MLTFFKICKKTTLLNYIMEEYHGCIGIDLGTTFSCVAVWENDNVKIIPNKIGSNTTPSWVYYGDDNVVVGQRAKELHSRFPDKVVYDIKRLMGKRVGDTGVRDEIDMLTYAVEANANDMPIVMIDGREGLRPEQVSACILQELKECAQDYLGAAVKRVVITVPAYFNDTQRNATKNAAAIAGLECMRIINEPTAACLCYGIEKQKEANVLVYDFGGGTLDVSIVSVCNGVFEVLGTNGDTHLGGVDFDEALCNFVLSDLKVKRSSFIENVPYEKLYGKVRGCCEKLKKELSSSLNSTIYLDEYDYERVISRQEFVLLCEDIFERCTTPVYNVLHDAEMEPSEIDEIVLVGGSSRIPRIQELLLGYFHGKRLNKGVNPDEAVAYGAAVQGAILSKSDESEKTRDIVLLDVIPLSLGLETSGGMMAKIIEKNCSIPTEKSQMFSTTEDDQSVVSIKVFEGERPFTEHNHFLGSFDLTGLEPLPRGVAKIEVTFAIDENGILSVSAVDKRTGMSNNVTISNDSGRLSQEEISRMLREADRNISNDEARKQVKEEYKTFVKYLQAMRDSLNSDEAKQCLSYDEVTRSNAYIIEVFQFLEENKDDLLIDRLRGYREETESNIGPLVYKIYERNKIKKVELSEEEVIQKINNL